MEIIEHITTPHERGWQWFVEHAKSRFALAWLALLGVADTIFFPISVEAFLAALVLAHRERWRTFLAVSLASSTLGAALGYGILWWIFSVYGEQALAHWGLGYAYTVAQTLVGGQIFFTMLVATFTPLPDKLFIYAAGILGAPFAPYIAGFAIGRGARMAVVTYLVWRLGPAALDIVNKYSLPAAIVAALVLVAYVMVRLNILPL